MPGIVPSGLSAHVIQQLYHPISSKTGIFELDIARLDYEDVRQQHKKQGSQVGDKACSYPRVQHLYMYETILYTTILYSTQWDASRFSRHAAALDALFFKSRGASAAGRRGESI